MRETLPAIWDRVLQPFTTAVFVHFFHQSARRESQASKTMAMRPLSTLPRQGWTLGSQFLAVFVIVSVLSELGTAYAEATKVDSDLFDLEDDGKVWFDCSAELGITPKLQFANVHSEPPIVTRESGQIVYKTITYIPDKDGDEALINIKADLTQMYWLFQKHWITFLKAPGINQCTEHNGTEVDPQGLVDGPLCPLPAKTPANIFHIHPKLLPFTPHGLYRSRQVYRDGDTGEVIGCVDMRFWYCAEGEERSKCGGEGRMHGLRKLESLS